MAALQMISPPKKDRMTRSCTQLVQGYSYDE
jgi:hypothetical protein